MKSNLSPQSLMSFRRMFSSLIRLNRKLISLIGILLAVVIGMGLTFASRAGNEESWNEEAAPAMTAASLRLLNSFSEIPASYGKRARGCR